MKFSKRTNWEQSLNRLTELKESMIADGRTIIDLTASNPTELGFAYPERAILEAFQSSQILNYSPDPRGLLSAREAVVEHYRERGASITPDNIFLQSSTSEAYSTLFRLLCDPGDSVLVPKPSYPLFDYLAELNDVTPATYPVRFDGEWHIDLAALNHSITSRTRAIIVVSPHNPTGMFLKRKELDALSVLAREHNLALIVDEVFIDYGFSEDRHRAPSSVSNAECFTFTLNGISKMLALPQMKLGWIAVSGPHDAISQASSRLETICDTYLSVNTPVQAALPQLLRACVPVRDEINRRAQNNFSYLREALLRPGPCSLIDSEGGWYGLISVPRTKSDEEWCIELLGECGVFAFPGHFFELEEGHLVLSLLVPGKDFTVGVDRIISLVSKS